MSTTNSTTIRLGSRVRIVTPYMADYHCTGVITRVEDSCYGVTLDGDTTGSRLYAAPELERLPDPTPEPVSPVAPVAPRLADTDWSRFVVEAEAMAREIAAVTPGITAREAGDCAAQRVEANYAAELARSVEIEEMIADAHYPDGSPRHALPTVYAVADILDDLVVAVDTARRATDNRRWLNAIDAAFDHLLHVEVIEVGEHNALVYRSESGTTYHANGTCQCVAFAQGQPCKHRAASKLVKNALHA